MGKEEHYKQRSRAYGMSHTRRDRILGLVPADAQRILDVGCADGRFGALLKTPQRWVGGIELSEVAVETAREKLDQVWSFDIEHPWPSELQAEDIDVIILSEILEHVFDPVAVLRSAKEALRDGGSLIITTPNFLTWTNRLRFLIGNFRYQEEGMFDFGHIRWFTYRYLREALAAAGFSIQKERHILFPGKLSAFLKYWPSLFAWQFIVRAQKK